MSMNEMILGYLEKQFYENEDHMVVPELLRYYYEEKEFECVFYYADHFEPVFEICHFYQMMALMELGHDQLADYIFLQYKADWFEILHQHNVYWKHVILFALYFKQMSLPESYQFILNEYYDDALVSMFDFMMENEHGGMIPLGAYGELMKHYPVLQKVWQQTQAQGKTLMTFEKMQWKIWKKYNDSLDSKLNYNMSCVYQNEITIYSYKPKEVAASMHIITDGKMTLIFDCGCEINEDSVVRIPVQKIIEDLNLPEIQGVFISHAHMDHYGSLKELQKYTVYMNEDTRQLIRLVSPDLDLNEVEIVENWECVRLNGVEVCFIPNGHIKGSVLFDIDWKGKKRIVYTGDYTVEDQNMVTGLHVEELFQRSSKKVDVLITETTYGKKKGMLTLKQYEKCFQEICTKMVMYKRKVVIPCFAIGRAQEVALMLSQSAREHGFKILIDGLASKITEYYQFDSDMPILNRNISICNSDMDIIEKLENNDIILASSGMMKQGSTSYRYVENVLNHSKICIMKVGFIHPFEHMLMSIMNRRNKNVTLFEIPLSAHAGYESLVETISKISADCVIYVHGNGIEKE